MRFFLLLAASICALALVCAAPPKDVGGYTLSITDYPARVVWDVTQTHILLKPNGTYVGLLRQDWTEATVGREVIVSALTSVSIPADGTWSYRVLDENTAEITVGLR